jgi:hypothetical protein
LFVAIDGRLTSVAWVLCATCPAADGVRGIIATGFVEACGQLASVPYSSTFTVIEGEANTQECPISSAWINHAYWQEAPWHIKLATWVLYERSKGEDSKFAVYLQQLPRVRSIHISVQ